MRNHVPILLLVLNFVSIAGATPVIQTFAFRFLKQDCTQLIGDRHSSGIDGSSLDTSSCKRDGINFIFQLRPGPNAPESLRGIPFTWDMHDETALQAAPNERGAMVIDRMNGILYLSSSLFHIPDRYHGLSRGSLDSAAFGGMYWAQEGDTLFFNAVYREPFDSSGMVYQYFSLGEDCILPGCSHPARIFNGCDSLHEWEYGHLSRFEIIRAGGHYTDPVRPACFTGSCSTGTRLDHITYIWSSDTSCGGFGFPDDRWFVSLKAGWNLASQAGGSYALPRTLTSLFPSAYPPFYRFSTATKTYEIADTAHIGTGYWLLAPRDTEYWIWSGATSEVTCTLGIGWNLVGGIYTEQGLQGVPIDSLRSVPPGIIVPGSYWQYDPILRVYQATDTLLPGRGVFLLSDSPGMLYFGR